MSTTYYLDTQGNDTHTGKTPQQAWHSLERLKHIPLQPGDQIILTEGQEFHGGLPLSADRGGTPQKPIVIRGSGARRATIIASGTPAIEAHAGGIEIRDLILKSSPAAAPPEKGKEVAGLRFYTVDPHGKVFKHVRIERVAVTGFSGDGISIGSWHDSQPGFDDVILSHVDASGNGGSGAYFFGKRDREKPKGSYPHRNVRITDCTFSHNASGTGLVLSGVQDTVVEYCLASKNNGAGGGVGIWAFDSQRVRFHHCIVEGTQSRGKDGGGFDLDGGCIDCVIERCLAYHNDGPGFMHCDYPTAGHTKGNVIRSCISIDDGRKTEQTPAFGFGFVAWGSGLEECRLERNLVIVTKSFTGKESEGALFITRIPGYGGQGDDMHIKGCLAKDNIVVVTGKDVPLLMLATSPAWHESRYSSTGITMKRGECPPLLWMARSATAHSLPGAKQPGKNPIRAERPRLSLCHRTIPKRPRVHWMSGAYSSWL
ncbi:MAG: right-handed parallel beta-helix repeat-containing protein [Armatimonas sp.]